MMVPPFPEKWRFEKMVHAQQRHVAADLTKEGELRLLLPTQWAPAAASPGLFVRNAKPWAPLRPTESEYAY